MLRDSDRWVSRSVLDQGIGDGDCRRHIERSLQRSAWIVMVGDGFDDRIRQAPKTQQVRPNFSMSYCQHLGLDFMHRPAACLGCKLYFYKLFRNADRQYQLSDIVKQGGGKCVLSLTPSGYQALRHLGSDERMFLFSLK